jgi:hypothetical protein
VDLFHQHFFFFIISDFRPKQIVIFQALSTNSSFQWIKQNYDLSLISLFCWTTGRRTKKVNGTEKKSKLRIKDNQILINRVRCLLLGNFFVHRFTWDLFRFASELIAYEVGKTTKNIVWFYNIWKSGIICFSNRFNIGF